MAQLREVQVGAEQLERFDTVIGPERTERFVAAAAAARQELDGRTVWNVNSTASGGGVAEMLGVLLSYARGAGIDARWIVIEGTPDFFDVTKRLHNLLHGTTVPTLDDAAREVYEQVARDNGDALAEVVRPGDIVLLHDPQAAGMVGRMTEVGALVVWRAHIGTDEPNAHVEAAWSFLRPYLEAAHGFVFSREEHVHPWMPESSVTIVPPSIDPFAPKNQELRPEVVRAILGSCGLLPLDGRTPRFHRRDGSPGTVVRAATLVRGDTIPDPDLPTVVQVSRWDRLKDMAGVMEGFAHHIAAPTELVLAGPSVEGVTDDPEGAEVLAECVEFYDRLPARIQARIRLVTLPMEDVDENAAMVNAIQRHAAVVVQKSLQEGFGLTVSEALLKQRAVVASRVGGIQDQIEDGRHGLLLEDPSDLAAMGVAVTRLIGDGELRRELGAAGRERVLDRFVGDRHLIQYAELFGSLLRRREQPANR